MAVRQHRRATGGAGAAGIMAVVWAVTAGCSGTGAVADERPGGDAVAEVRQAADRLAHAGSSRTRTAMEMAAGGTRVIIRGEGVYDYRRRLGRLTVRLPQDPAGRDDRPPITELLAPGALYMKNRGAGVPADKWVRVDVADLSDGNLVTGGATDPFAAAEVLRGVLTASFVGRERLGGTSVRHYRGTADLAAAAEGATAAENRTALGAAAKGFASASVPFDVFLDDEGRIRKLRHRFSFANGRRDSPVAVASTTELYDFGVGVDVRLPDGEDIYAGTIAEETSAPGPSPRGEGGAGGGARARD